MASCHAGELNWLEKDSKQPQKGVEGAGTLLFMALCNQTMRAASEMVPRGNFHLPGMILGSLCNN